MNRPYIAPKIPSIHEQIDFINKARKKDLVLLTREHVEMFRAIETNLVTIKLLNAKENGKH